MAGPRAAPSKVRSKGPSLDTHAETSVQDSSSSIADNSPATGVGEEAQPNESGSKPEPENVSFQFNDADGEENQNPDNDSFSSFSLADEEGISIGPQTPSFRVHRQSLWSQMQTPVVQNAQVVAVPPTLASAGDERAREIEIKRVRDSIHEMASLLDEIQSMRSQSNVANLTSSSSNAHRSVLTAQSLHSANITDALTDTSVQLVAVDKDDLGARVPFLKPAGASSPLKMTAKPPSQLAPSPPKQKTRRRPHSTGDPVELSEGSIGEAVYVHPSGSVSSKQLQTLYCNQKTQTQRRASAQTFEAAQPGRRESVSRGYGSVTDEGKRDSLDRTPADLQDAPVPPPHGRSTSQASVGTMSLLSCPSSRVPSVPARNENHRSGMYVAPSQSDVYKPTTNDSGSDEEPPQPEEKIQVSKRHSKRMGSAAAPGAVLAAAEEGPPRERRRHRVQSESRATTERRRRQQFSRETIESLLARDEQTSYTFAALELPPTEASLMERFVDALSKLSVEIQLDDRKRDEGRRRMRNALNALEGWM